MKFKKNDNNKKHTPKLRKFRIIFDIENWLWKSEIWIFQSIDLEHTLIYQKIFFLWKSAIFHQIKLPFDAKAAERILKVFIDIFENFNF